MTGQAGAMCPSIYPREWGLPHTPQAEQRRGGSPKGATAPRTRADERQPGPTCQQPPISQKSDTSGPQSCHLNPLTPLSPVRRGLPQTPPPHCINSPPSSPFTPPALQASLPDILKTETNPPCLLALGHCPHLCHSPELLLLTFLTSSSAPLLATHRATEATLARLP